MANHSGSMPTICASRNTSIGHGTVKRRLGHFLGEATERNLFNAVVVVNHQKEIPFTGTLSG